MHHEPHHHNIFMHRRIGAAMPILAAAKGVPPQIPKIPFAGLRIPPVQGKSIASSRHHKRRSREYNAQSIGIIAISNPGGEGCVPTKSSSFSIFTAARVT